MAYALCGELWSAPHHMVHVNIHINNLQKNPTIQFKIDAYMTIQITNILIYIPILFGLCAT